MIVVTAAGVKARRLQGEARLAPTLRLGPRLEWPPKAPVPVRHGYLGSSCCLLQGSTKRPVIGRTVGFSMARRTRAIKFLGSAHPPSASPSAKVFALRDNPRSPDVGPRTGSSGGVLDSGAGLAARDLEALHDPPSVPWSNSTRAGKLDVLGIVVDVLGFVSWLDQPQVHNAENAWDSASLATLLAGFVNKARNCHFVQANPSPQQREQAPLPGMDGVWMQPHVFCRSFRRWLQAKWQACSRQMWLGALVVLAYGCGVSPAWTFRYWSVDENPRCRCTQPNITLAASSVLAPKASKPPPNPACRSLLPYMHERSSVMRRAACATLKASNSPRARGQTRSPIAVFRA